MLALTPMLIAGLLYASMLTVEDTIYQHKVHTLLHKASCNPKIPADADELPQQAPEDIDPPCIDGPNSVFHPFHSFDDLVNRNDLSNDPKVTDINVRH